MSPDGPLNCLLVQPPFSHRNFWNYVRLANGIGAKTPAPPLGLLTVAALLPQHWNFRLVDLNARPLTEADWKWADLVCTGGMLPQQPGILQVISEAQSRGKYVAVGGADPSSQPEIYAHADVCVVGEGENTIPLWLDSWRNGQPKGMFQAAKRPDVSSSPVPRFDLIRFDDYVHIGVQFSRGCPFNCEFCDIIELYGRVPRSKTPAQVVAELETLYKLGYRGWLDIVDDNFIGNRKLVKPLLESISTWSREKGYPFYFSTEATMNLADDEELMKLMQDCDFRHVFMGIETPDPELLAFTQKRVNAMRPIVERVQRIYDHGMTVAAGFIMGFDAEKPGNDQAIIKCIEDTGIVISMVGLLVALPNTQLATRLQKERRLLSPDLTIFTDHDGPYRLKTAGSYGEAKDNQAAGINFLTLRDRVEIYQEYQRVINSIFDPDNYMDRVLSTVQRVNTGRKHLTSWREVRRETRGFFFMMAWMTRNPRTRWKYWRNTIRSLLMGINKFDLAQTMMAMYLHFHEQSKFVSAELDQNIDFALHHAKYPRQVPAPLAITKHCETSASAVAS